MIIEELRIENLFSHKNTEVRFHEGINVIVGENGSGKTSILNSIALALFKIKPEGLRFRDIIRLGAREGKVELKFRIGNRRYLIIRKISDYTSSYLYEINGNERILISKDEKTIEKILRQLLEINEDVFINSIYIRQGEIPSIIHKPPSERKKILAKILGIENLETAYKEMEKIRKVYKSRLDFLEEYRKEYERLNSEIFMRKKNLEGLKVEYKKLKSEYEKLVVEKDNIEKELEELEGKMQYIIKLRELKERLRKLNEEISFLKEKEEFVKKNREKYEEYLRLKKAYEKLKEEIIRMKEVIKSKERVKEELAKKSLELRKISREILEMENKLRENFGDINLKEISKLYKEVEDSIKLLESQREKILEETSKIKAIINQEERFLEELRMVKDRCPVCDSKIDKDKKELIMKRKVQRINEMRLNLKELNKNLEKIESEISKRDYMRKILLKYNPEYIEMLLNRKKSLEEEISLLEREIDKDFDKIIREKERMLNDLEINLKDLEKIYNRYITCVEILKEKNIETLINERDRISKEINEIVKIIGSEEEISSRINLLRKVKDEIEQRMNNLLKRISKLEGMISSEEENLKKYEKRLEEVREKIKERNVLAKFIKFLEHVRKIFGKDYLQKKIREQYIPLIEEYTKHFFKKFNISFSDIKLSEDLDITIIRGNGRLPLDSLSGGEKISLALSLRLAISRIFASKMELLILDEPTIHLDSNRKYCLINILKELRDIPQMIIVTHDKEFEQIGENLIEVYKENNMSKISQRIPTYV